MKLSPARLFTLIALIAGLLVGYPGGASARAATDCLNGITTEGNDCAGQNMTGFLTLSNPETGVTEVAMFCEAGKIEAIAIINGDASYLTGASIGDTCTPEALGGGFTRITNIDPNWGWVVAYTANPEVYAVYTCQRGGMTYASGYSYQPASGMKVEIDWQPGGCHPGVMPG